MRNFVEQMSVLESNTEPKLKRARQSESEREGNEDRLSDLPDSLVLHILSFLNCKDAVRTCILSRRWKNLWKQLPSLILRSWDFRNVTVFTKFVPRILSLRDDSLALHTLEFERSGITDRRLLIRVLSYAISHNVQRLRINVQGKIPYLPGIFSCQSLTSLKLSVHARHLPKESLSFPKSLNLPALTSLHLRHFSFHASDNDRAEPFSGCKRLNNLVIASCTLWDAKILCISSASLSSLAFRPRSCDLYEVVLSTPNLRSFAFEGVLFRYLSGRNLSSVERVHIDADVLSRDSNSPSVLLDWLIGLTNVQSLTVCANTLQVT